MISISERNLALKNTDYQGLKITSTKKFGLNNQDSRVITVVTLIERRPSL